MNKVNWSEIKALAFDFDGVFTDDLVWVSEEGFEMVACSRSDGLGIELLHHAGVRMVIISKESNPVVGSRARKLSLDVIQDCDHKLIEFSGWLRQIGIAAENSGYMGNDVTDIECMELAGIAIAPCNAHPKAIEIADVITKKPGGRGAVREVADKIINSRQVRP